LLAVAALLCGAGKPPKDHQVYLPSYAPPAAPVRPANGAIFQAEDGYAPLTSGLRAARVGDIITITLVEQTQAAKTASTTTDRKGSIGITPPTTGPLALFSATDAQAGGNQSFDGKGQAQQSNSLFGEISVTVAQVYPNGNMLVRGEKSLTLNRGDEFIRVSGIVRAVDIGADNKVPSTRLADAKISYSGKGDVARASRQGWLQRFFSVVSPF
jgi:flagellar L-ring protein precursor FlgH